MILNSLKPLMKPFTPFTSRQSTAVGPEFRYCLSVAAVALLLLVPGLCPAAQPTFQWSNTGKLGTSRAEHTGTLLLDGRVLVIGGVTYIQASQTVLDSAEIYNPGTASWSTTGNMSIPRVAHTATLLGDGRVLVAGGKSEQYGTSVDSVELYDPASGSLP